MLFATLLGLAAALAPGAEGPIDFEVATIKPHNPDVPGFGIRIQGRRFTTVATSLNSLIAFAYGLHPRQILRAPSWAGTEKYDIVAEATSLEETANSAVMMRRVQALLASRFALGFHREKKTLSAYKIVVGKKGPTFLKDTGDANANPTYGFRGLGMMMVSNARIGNFAGWLQRYVLDRPVVDQTGIQGVYSFNLTWKADEFQFSDQAGGLPHAPDEANRSDLYTAIQQQLGLRLLTTKAQLEVLVIDHADRPSAN